MRISDWSSDVCSSDLADVRIHFYAFGNSLGYVDRKAGGRPADRRVERALGVFDDDLVRGDVELRRRVAQLSVELVAKLKIMNFHVLEEIGGIARQGVDKGCDRSEAHTSELHSLMRISYAVFCLKKQNHA